MRKARRLPLPAEYFTQRDLILTPPGGFDNNSDSFGYDDFVERCASQTSFEVEDPLPPQKDLSYSSSSSFSELSSVTSYSSVSVDEEHNAQSNGDQYRVKKKLKTKKRSAKRSAVHYQLRYLVTCLVYLGPFATGFNSTLLLLSSQPSEDVVSPFAFSSRFMDGEGICSSFNLLLLGGLSTSVLLFLLLRLMGRLRLLAAANSLGALAVMALATMDKYNDGGGNGWAASVAAFLGGAAAGIHVPVQQLFSAETCVPARRTSLGILNYFLLWAGATTAYLATKAFDDVDELRLAAAAAAGAALAVISALGCSLFHPDTPRSLFLQDRRSECVDSLQWLRGPWTDIGLEYIELSDALEDRCKKDCGGQEREIFQWMDDALDRSIIQPLLTSTSLLTLMSTAGMLSFSKILLSSLCQSRVHTISGFNSLPLLYLALGLLCPCLLLLLTAAAAAAAASKNGCSGWFCGGRKKSPLLMSAAAAAATALFQGMLAHFQRSFEDDFDEGEDSWSSLFGWVVPLGTILFLAAYQMGVGPIGPMAAIEILPARAVGPGLTLGFSLWWAFNLLFSLTLDRILSVVGLPTLCWLHFLVCTLLYGVILQLLPDVRETNSLGDIETFYLSCSRWGGIILSKQPEDSNNYGSITNLRRL